MHKIKTGTDSTACQTTFKIPSNSYQACFSRINYSKSKTRLRKSSFRISLRGPARWKNFVANTKKELESSCLLNQK